MKKWTDVTAYLESVWPQTRANLLAAAAMDDKMRKLGMKPPAMPEMLQEAIRIAKEEK